MYAQFRMYSLVMTVKSGKSKKHPTVKCFPDKINYATQPNLQNISTAVSNMCSYSPKIRLQKSSL